MMGDLNLTPQETAIVYLGKQLKDGCQTKKTFHGPYGTFSGFD